MAPTSAAPPGRLRVVLPVAGRGTRLRAVGGARPKCLVRVAGRELMLWALGSIDHEPRDVVVVYHSRQRDALLPELERLLPLASLVEQRGALRGASDTVYCAADHLADAAQVAVVDCDFFARSAFARPGWADGDRDGSVLTVRSADPSKSFVALRDGWVAAVREKEPISDRAIAGIYHFAHPADLLSSIEQQSRLGLRTRGELFLSGALGLYLERRPRFAAVPARRFADLGDGAGVAAFERRMLRLRRRLATTAAPSRPRRPASTDAPR